jgi:hypothetical protein
MLLPKRHVQHVNNRIKALVYATSYALLVHKLDALKEALDG